MNILDVKNLNIYFKMYDKFLNQTPHQAIFNLDLEVKKGEILAIAGSSGSGKSLLAHAIMGILPENAVVEGDILYNGEKLTAKNIDQYRGNHISLIPQSVSYLDPLMKIKNQVKCKGTTDEMSEQVLAKFGMTNIDFNKYPFQLSGGMARRVLISSSILSNADLIIADEPTPGLNLDLAMDTLKVFRQLADEGKTIILISHDVDLVCNIADRMALFYGGRILEVIEVSNFLKGLDYLKHPLAKAFWEALPQNGFKDIDMDVVKNQCIKEGWVFPDHSEFI